MSEESPFKVVESEYGIGCRFEWDAHYISDEDMQLIAERFDELKRENAELRELVRDYDRVLDAAVDVWGIMADVLGYGSKYDALHDRMRELGIEVEE